jgi:hypothetical protein
MSNMNVGGSCQSQMMADRMNGVHGTGGCGQSQQPSACDRAAQSEFEQAMGADASQGCGQSGSGSDSTSGGNMDQLMAQLLPLLMQLIEALGQGQTQGTSTQQPYA